MRFQLGMLCGLAASSVATASTIRLSPRQELCIDCETPLVANPGWENGVLANGNYYQPTKSGNWMLGTSTNGEGQLELRYDSSTNSYYVYNLCPNTHSGYCRVYIAQVITVQAGVQYAFEIEYQMANVRSQANNMEMSISTMDRTQVFAANFFSGSTPSGLWATWKSGTFQVDTSGDMLVTLTWRNDPNNAQVLIRNVNQTPVLCKDSGFVPSCPAASSSAALPSSAAPSASSASLLSSAAPSSAVPVSSAVPSLSVVPSSSAQPSVSVAPSSSMVISSSIPPSSSAAPLSSAAPSSAVPVSSGVPLSSATSSAPLSSSALLPSSSLVPSVAPSSSAPSIIPSSSAVLSSSALPSISPSSSTVPSSTKRPCRRRPRSSSAVPNAPSSTAQPAPTMTIY